MTGWRRLTRTWWINRGDWFPGPARTQGSARSRSPRD